MIKITEKVWVALEQVEFLESIPADKIGDHSRTCIGFVSGRNRIVDLVISDVVALLHGETLR